MDAKATLLRYLRNQRDGLIDKIEGLGEYDLRRPLTHTGTNLLGLVKHVASVQVGYLGECFGRPSPWPLPWYADVVREQLDGRAGLVAGDVMVPTRTDEEWAAYRARIEQAARDLAGR